MEYLPIIIMSAIGLGIGIWWGKIQKRNNARKNMDEHKKRGRHKKRSYEKS